MDTDELSETGGVVISHSFGVTVSLQDRVGLDDLVLKRGLLLLSFLHLLSGRGTDEGKVGDDLLGVLSFSGSRFSGNQNRLILAF